MGCRTCGTTSRAGRIIAEIIERNAGAQTEALLGGMGAAKAKAPFKSKKKKSTAKKSTKKSTKKTSTKESTSSDK